MADGLGIPGISGAKAIGRGGTGVVYRCRHDASGREVAVKVLDQINLDDEGAKAFRRDFAKLAEATDDPMLVTVLGMGVLGNRHPYLVVDYIDGGSLGSISSTGSLDPDVAAAILAEVCAAVERLHQAGYAHGDITPNNILLTTDGEPRLSGFGIAQYFALGPHSASLSVSPVHGAPEVLAGRPQSAAADVWSLASVMFDSVARTSAFGPAGDPGAELVARALSGVEPDVSAAPENLQAILGAALVLEPSMRCSAAQMASSLRQVAGHRLDVVPAAIVEPSIAISTTPRGARRALPKNSGIFADSAPPPAYRRVLGVAATLVFVFGLFVAAVATRPPEDPVDEVSTGDSATTDQPDATTGAVVGPSSSLAGEISAPTVSATTTRAATTRAPTPATTTAPPATTTSTTATTDPLDASGDTSTTTDPDASTTTIDPNASTTTADPNASTTTTDPNASTTTTSAASTTTATTASTSTTAATTTTADAVTTTSPAVTTTTAAPTTTTALVTTTTAGG